MIKINKILILSLFFIQTSQAQMYFNIKINSNSNNVIVNNTNNNSNNENGNGNLIEPSNPQEWVEFLNNNCAYNFASINEMQTDMSNNIAQCSSLNISQLPSSTGLPDHAYGLNLSNNNLTNITGISNVQSFQELHLSYNSGITNLNGLSNINNIDIFLRLEGTNIPNLNGLENLTSLPILVLDDNPSLTSLNGIENVTSIDAIQLVNTPNLEDISALSNITSAYYGVYVDKGVYTTKINGESWLCNEGFNNIRYFSPFEDAGSPNREDVCDVEPFEGSGDPQWVEWYNYLNPCQSELGGNNTLYTDPAQTEYNIKSKGIVCYRETGDTPPTDLLGLNSISTINLVEANITTLPNFEGLKSVNGNLNLIGNNINDISQLSSITNVDGDFDLSYNNISDFSSLNSELKVGGVLYIMANPITTTNSLLHIDFNNGGLAVDGIPTLRDINALAGVTTLKYFSASNTGISNVDALSSLTKIDHLGLSTTFNLENINGLSNLREITTSGYISESNITNLNGLRNLNIVETLTIRDNSNLSDISGLSGLSGHVEYLTIIYNGNITTLEGLKNITSFRSANIRGTNISSLNGLENITSVRNLIMIDNDNLTDISALNNLTSIQSTLRLPNNNYTVKIDGGSYVCNEGLSKVRLGWTTTAPNRTDICTY